MKCRNCDREAVYDDGLCEECHRAAQQGNAKVMSDAERDSFRGQTIEEDGTVRDHSHKYSNSYERVTFEEQTTQGNGRPSFFHIITSQLPLRVKFALGFIIFCIVAIIVSALGFSLWAMPYLLGALAIYFVYSILKSVFNR